MFHVGPSFTDWAFARVYYRVFASDEPRHLARRPVPEPDTAFCVQPFGHLQPDALTRVVPGLAAGESNTGASVLTIPAGSALGGYYLLANADATNIVNESPETNNVTGAAIQVTISP